MLGYHIRKALAVAIGAMCWPGLAMAQPGSAEQLLSLDTEDLREEIGTRYDAALALTLDQAVVSADSNRFMWASHAKAQCGIAIGFLKSGTKDPVSIGKCVDAHDRMQVRQVTYAAPPPPPPPLPCNAGPYIVFFDWDRSEITAEAATILDSMAAGYSACGNAAVAIAGYTDRSGSDAYNQGLSERRGDAVRQYLGARSVSMGAMTTRGYGESSPRVPTTDGVRELQNRRVEITIQ
jgi:OmpA-OmpF porin, OOP family